MSAWRDRLYLLKKITQRGIAARYRGSVLGGLWAVLTPLLMLVIYTFVFSVVFKGRWAQVDQLGRFDFALMIYCGLSIFTLFAETVTAAPRVIVDQVSYVKKVVFPLELLPVSSFLTALFNMGISLVLLVSFAVITGGWYWTMLSIPLILFPLFFVLLGLAWALAALGVYLRDLSLVMTSVVGVLQFVSPVFYPVHAVPPAFQILMFMSPLTFPIEALRDAVLLHQWPAFWGLFIYSCFGFGVAVCGWWVFAKARRGFADVL